MADAKPSNRWKTKKGPFAIFIRTIIFTFCGFLFACQSFMLIDHYFAYPSQIATRLNKSHVIDLPGVTICFQGNLEGTSANEVFKRNFKSNKDGPEIRCYLQQSTIAKEATKYGSIMLCEDVSPVVQSINYGSGQVCYTYFSKLTSKDGSTNSDFQIRMYDMVDHLNTVAKNDNILEIEIDFPGQSESRESSRHEATEATLIIHSNTDLPGGREKVTKIKPGLEYLVSFSRTTEKKMPAPFTSCSYFENSSSSYNASNGRGSSYVVFDGLPRSNYECMGQCLYKMYRESCQCLPSNLNIRRDLVYSNDKFCGDTKCNLVDIRRCKDFKLCPPDCLEHSYQYYSEGSPMYLPLIHYKGLEQPNGVAIGVRSEVISTFSKSLVSLRKSSTPDIVYEHHPQFDYLEFVFQMATLACVWLGLSIFTLFWKPVYLCGKMAAKLICLKKNVVTVPMVQVE